jgi:DNA-binding GntR family transcriptional regulator
MILQGELRSGQRLPQDDLAERLGVSRTPLLSAFSKLEREMLVETVPRRGSFVRAYTSDELLNIYDIRLRLEPLGARGATERATDAEIEELVTFHERYESVITEGDAGRIKEHDYEFHMMLMRMSRNEFLQNIISSNNIILIANTVGLLKPPLESLEQHRNVIAAVRMREADLAEEQMYHHLFTSRARLLHDGLRI